MSDRDKGLELVQFNGGMIGSDGMSSVPAWPIPHACLVADREQIRLDARGWVLGRGMHVRMLRPDVVRVFATSTFGSFFWVQFQGGKRFELLSAFVTMEPDAVLAALSGLGWPVQLPSRD